MPTASGAAPHPDLLFVDMDGTLVRTDTLWESSLSACKRRPWLPFTLLARSSQGWPACKRAIAAAARFHPSRLPYDPHVLAFLREERRRGTTIVLATAADRRLAEPVAAHLGLFDAVIATDGAVNLAGAAKLEAMRAYAKGRPFGYVGDSRADLPVWAASAVAHVVDRRGIAAQVPADAVVGRVFTPPRPNFMTVVRALRVRQWMKNALIFAPLILSHRLTEPGRLAAALAAFGAFCLCASGVYVLNDLADLDADRAHPTKRTRPFAAGELRVPEGLALAGGCFVGAVALSLASLPPAFLGVLAGYAALTTAYTGWLKRLPVADVLALAQCYAWRVFAGSVATGIPSSGWLLVFSSFFFVSLAFLKRYAELEMLRRHAVQPSAAGRGYAPGDADMVRALGAASGVAAVFVMALYVTNPQVTVLYRHPPVLWGIVPVALYWLGRLWMLAGRGKLKDDPFVFTVGDRASYATALVAAVILFAAT